LSRKAVKTGGVDLDKYLISGGRRLEGSVYVSGAKNAALALIAASILAPGETILENVPRIADVKILLNIVEKLGAKVAWLEENTVSLTVPEKIDYIAPHSLVKRLRASNLLLGGLLAARGKAQISMPGGCNIGIRPMDLHLKGLHALGAEVEIEHGFIKASGRLQGNRVYLDFPSVGATENIMMAATRAKGTTIIENVAKEPEIVDLANFLNAMGAKVRGAGTDLIRIEGVKELKSTCYSVIADRIEAGTLMVAGAITRGNVTIGKVISRHLQPVIAKLREMGVEIIEDEEYVHVAAGDPLKPTDIKTLPYPGFPTDMQSQMMAILATCQGTSVIVENVFENRLQVAEELNRMGANIKVEGQTAVVQGVEKLSGAHVRSCDLRSGAGLVLAGLAAEGVTEVSNIRLIDRGYEKFEQKLNQLGAQIRRVQVRDVSIDR
jgi:UDP-N-acetylglucosamine 1-carboxyvinyltransferase